jgi:hypothetical protein
VCADDNSQLPLLQQEERRIQFKLSSGRVSFDMCNMAGAAFRVYGIKSTRPKGEGAPPAFSATIRLPPSHGTPCFVSVHLF